MSKWENRVIELGVICWLMLHAFLSLFDVVFNYLNDKIPSNLSWESIEYACERNYHAYDSQK